MSLSPLVTDETSFINNAAPRLRARGWQIESAGHIVRLLREAGGLWQRGELRRTALGGWDLYQRVTPARKLAPLPSVAVLACPRETDFDWNDALHALDCCLMASLLSG